MRIRVLPYKQGSKGAKALAEALGGRVLKLQDSRYTPRPGDLIINWGSSRVTPGLLNAGVVNDPEAIAVASNKLSYFERMREVAPGLTPDFWTSKEDIPAEAYPIVCRTILNGHSGAGIVIANTPEDVVPASLYVQYIKKKDEYRVHVGSANIITIQRKARSRDVADENVNWLVRNHDNGFIYVRNNVVPPQSVTDVALRAMEHSGLDFGAVDVIWHERTNKAYVLEVNTAPGLEGQTIQDYAEFFKKEKE